MALTSRLRLGLARNVEGDKGNKKAAAKAKGKAKKPSSPPSARKIPPREIGGAEGPDPTRYGDWQHKGRCSDF